jgi:hypothetical protein
MLKLATVISTTPQHDANQPSIRVELGTKMEIRNAKPGVVEPERGIDVPFVGAVEPSTSSRCHKQ